MKAGRARGDLCWRGKRLAVERNGEPFDVALIDVAVSDHGEIGAKAIWEADRLSELVLSQGLPTRIGLSAIGGMLEPLGPREGGGLHIRLNPRSKSGRVIRAGIRCPTAAASTRGTRPCGAPPRCRRLDVW